jgi:hypothetical protein
MFFHGIFALIVFTGHLADRLTGQDMAGVTVTIAGAKARPVTTDSTGRFRVRLAPGTYTLRFESQDVPLQQFPLKLAPVKMASRDYKICSVTLDYRC